MAILFSIMLGVVCLLLAIISGDNHVYVTHVTVKEDQFVWRTQEKCYYGGSETTIWVLHAVEGAMLLVLVRLCYMTRKVSANISDAKVVTSVVVETIALVIVVIVVVEAIDLDPFDRRFVIGLIISVVNCRLLWLLFHQVCWRVWLGYDLDQGLQLKKCKWSVTETAFVRSILKKIGMEDGFGTDQGLSDERMNQISSKVLAKYASKKNVGELKTEIDVTKQKMVELQVELSALENMFFAVTSGDSSSHNSGNKSQEDSSLHGDVEGQAAHTGLAVHPLGRNPASVQSRDSLNARGTEATHNPKNHVEQIT